VKASADQWLCRSELSSCLRASSAGMKGLCVRRWIRPKPFLYIDIASIKTFWIILKTWSIRFLHRLCWEFRVQYNWTYNFSMLIIEFATTFWFKIIILLVTSTDQNHLFWNLSKLSYSHILILWQFIYIMWCVLYI